MNIPKYQKSDVKFIRPTQEQMMKEYEAKFGALPNDKRSIQPNHDNFGRTPRESR